MMRISSRSQHNSIPVSRIGMRTKRNCQEMPTASSCAGLWLLYLLPTDYRSDVDFQKGGLVAGCLG